MALKIVGRTSRSLQVREVAQNPMATRDIAFQCDACGKRAFVQLPYSPTPQQRQDLIRGALNEHRQVCTSGNAEQGRTYQIIYPRG